MQLKVGERSLIAGFASEDQALSCQDRLKQLDIEDVQVDRFSVYPDREAENTVENALTGDMPVLANTVFDTNYDRDTSIATSADPSASGLSDRNSESLDSDVVLTVVFPKDKLDKVKDVVREFGGYF